MKPGVRRITAPIKGGMPAADPTARYQWLQVPRYTNARAKAVVSAPHAVRLNGPLTVNISTRANMDSSRTVILVMKYPVENHVNP